ncbi:MAG: selenocysteine-specific translation elongation factor [Candidatus Dormibacterales bacterium]
MYYVVGTAGHIDHGKSTLVQALTGTDPDRLAEEKRRGMTIDLGFAYVTLPSGRLAGIVDVPGHARFIRNMLAGVHGVDCVLLVVAADEGVMPQTTEHLDIVTLLEIERGVVALTKADLVDEDWRELVTADLAERLGRSSLAGSAVVPVSAVTGAGLDELRAELDTVLERMPGRPPGERPRLPVDRVFTMGGFGTVVTGTLVDGPVRAGEALEVLPSGRRVRVRGLQQHGRQVDLAEPGSRVAANLTGVQKSELRRGDVLARPDSLRATRRLDASVTVLPDSPGPLRHGAHLQLYAGTAEVGTRAIVLGQDSVEPGERGWVQLYLAAPIGAEAGDRFVLRRPSPSATIAGGRFADVAPRRHARLDPAVVASLQNREAGGALLEELRKHPLGMPAVELARAARAEPSALEGLEARRVGAWVFSNEAWAAGARRAAAILAAYHREHPLRAGMPREELMSRLGLGAAAFGAVLGGLVEEGVLAAGEQTVSDPAHRVRPWSEDGPGARLLEVLSRVPVAPPSVADALREAGAGSEVLRALVEAGEVVMMSPDVAFTKAGYESAVAAVKDLAASGGPVTVAALRDRLGSSRRPMLALMEHLDSERITRRVGDARVLRQP